MGNEDLGKHLESIGDLAGAIEAYSRMRPDVSSPKHIIDVGKLLVSISVQRREWPMVAANLNKITSMGESPEEKAVLPYIRIMHGVALMGQEKYAEAASSFLQAGVNNSVVVPQDLITGNDVAVYGGLLALATMDRKELNSKVLENSDFRTFLELEPHIRRAISQFVNGRYSTCLQTLEAYRADYMLDLHLQRHVPIIYAQIRSKCIVNYLIPFSCVTLQNMEDAFAVPGQALETELAGMIREGVLSARLDTINKVRNSPRGG